MPSLLLLYILDESIDSNLITIFQGVHVSEEIIFLPFFINLIFIISVSIIFFIFLFVVLVAKKIAQAALRAGGGHLWGVRAHQPKIIKKNFIHYPFFVAVSISLILILHRIK